MHKVLCFKKTFAMGVNKARLVSNSNSSVEGYLFLNPYWFVKIFEFRVKTRKVQNKSKVHSRFFFAFKGLC